MIRSSFDMPDLPHSGGLSQRTPDILSTVEAEAMPPEQLRALLRRTAEAYLPRGRALDAIRCLITPRPVPLLDELWIVRHRAGRLTGIDVDAVDIVRADGHRSLRGLPYIEAAHRGGDHRRQLRGPVGRGRADTPPSRR